MSPRTSRRHESAESEITTIEEAREILAEIHRRNDGELDGADRERWTAAESFIQTAETRMEHLKHLARSGSIDGPHRSPQNGAQGFSVRDEAMRSIEAATKDRSFAIDSRSAERIEQLTTTPLGARWTRAGLSPKYTTAFFKALGSERGHLLWDAEEAAAFREVEAVRQEMRSMGVTGAGTEGAFQVPVAIDPTLRLDTDSVTSPIRLLADVRRVLGQEFRPLTSAHVQSEWLGEHVEVGDHTEPIAEHPIRGHRLSSFITYSFEYESSGIPNFLGELHKLLLDGYEQLTAESSWDGNGTTEPEGLYTALFGGSSVDVPDFPGLDVDTQPYLTQNSLPPRFQKNASWLADLATINNLAQAETTNGSPRYPAVGDGKPVLLRKSLHEHSIQPSDVLVYGDIKQAFTLVDFAGSFVERVPHPFGPGGRPTGDRGLLLWARHGSGLVIENAVRVYDGSPQGS
ncbi:major capsid protein [Streptomyces violarus]|uniref:HK97 family phage major capsid protein n=1 Tax=Streptomyces violarus TaxID=67380 RepID=A0A7W4ZN68_9ACTN|nr:MULTISPECIES: phage major capsid protein [Streptomyces]MBB3075579.1 HK97 family phage major capsid protein [Streptomyces violarus]WRT98170.1 phage major capsid protein [Streptomyces sp. CGMCC 4.1772]GHD04355.1 major capsid protein [Streptomyces violarus]